MKRIKMLTPFIFACLLLGVSITAPAALSVMQDKTLLQTVQVEKISSPSAAENLDKYDFTAAERVNFLQMYSDGQTVTVSDKVMFTVKEEGRELSDASLNLKVLKEAELLQAQGGFPQFDLNADLHFLGGTEKKYVDMQDINRSVSVSIFSFSTDGVSFTVWADSETCQIYQYSVRAQKETLLSIDEQAVEEAYKNYLSLDRQQYQASYLFTSVAGEFAALKLKTFQ